MKRLIINMLLLSNAAKVGVRPSLHGILTSAPAYIKNAQNYKLYNFAA